MVKKIAQNIKLVAFDVDGVLTDGSISYTDTGSEIKTFNAKDGQGIVTLVRENILTAIITARQSTIVQKRGKELGIHYVVQGAKNKIFALQDIIRANGIELSEVAYVGDDLPDLSILEQVGLPCCPNDAVNEVKSVCKFVSSKDGGRGAVREVTDLIYYAKKAKENTTTIDLPSANN